jgi:ketosteroid isomerase-like protein
MSQENVEIVQAIYRAFDEGDAGAALERIAADAVWDLTNHSWPGEDQYFGHEGIVQVLSEFIGIFDDYKVTPERFIDAGDKVVVVQHELATHKGSDAGIDRRQASIYTMRGGKAVRIDHYLDIAKALEAAGLSE